MKVVSTYDFRDNLALYLDEVAKNETPIIISKFGKSLVKIVPIKASDKPNWDKFFGFMKSDSKETGLQYENRVRRSAKAKARTKRFRDRSI